MGYPIIVADGVEGLFIAVVIVASLIGRIVKASRDAASRQNGDAQPPPTSTQPRPPSIELKEFLESLALAQGPPIHASPPPPPKPRVAPRPVVATPPAATVAAAARSAAPRIPERVHQKRFAKAAATHTAMPRIKSYSAQPVPTPTLHLPIVPETAAPQVASEVRATTERATQTSLQKLLGGRTALRNAVILREILGPPLSLRSVPVGGKETG